MTKSDNVFNLIDCLLPAVSDTEISTPGEIQLLYAGVGMPSLRALDVGKKNSLTDYQAIKAANPIRQIEQLDEFQPYYISLRESALLEDEDALNDLGWLLLNGRWLPANPSLARRLFKLAASLGSAEALFNIAAQSSYGKGTNIDVNLAVGYYELAFEQGISCAALELGLLYESGDVGLMADCDLAAEWFLRGAQEGDLEACFNLGRLSLDEMSARFDEATGLYWLQLAAIQGHVTAAEHLMEFHDSFFASPDPERRLYFFWRDHAIRLGSSCARDMKIEYHAPQLSVVGSSSSAND